MRRTKMQLTSILFLGLILGFQNCTNPVTFSDTQYSLKALDMDGNEEQLVENPPQIPEENPVADIPEQVPEVPDEDVVAERPDDRRPIGRRPPKNSDDNDENGNGLYRACILNGPGKSLKLGLVASSLKGVHPVSSSVCITENACLQIVSQKFSVKGSYARGYCKGNPHVVRLTDAEVQSLINN